MLAWYYLKLPQEFIPHVAALLQMLLNKSKMSAASLSRVLDVTATLYRKAEQTTGNAVPNLVASAFLESVSEMLITKSKAISSSLSSAMEGHAGLPDADEEQRGSLACLPAGVCEPVRHCFFCRQLRYKRIIGRILRRIRNSPSFRLRNIMPPSRSAANHCHNCSQAFHVSRLI